MTATIADVHELDHPSHARAATEAPRAGAPSRRAIRAGWALGGLACLFLAMDTLMKLLQVQPAVEGTVQLGFSPNILVPLGLVELVALIAYLTPRVSALGAVLWTGYLGGAVCIHVQQGHALWTHTLFPIYFAALLWGGLWLRDRRVRALLA
jgi:hypothetical protein